MWNDPQDRPQASPAVSAQGAPLAGVRVLDLTRLLPGPMCTLHLADLGADVIKIEDLGAGDYAVAGVRRQVNRNKRGIRLDLKQPGGVQTLLRLCERADVLVESFRPGVMDRLGVGVAAAQARNPRLVYCSITGYGQTGPMREAAGHDMNYAALTGVAEQMGRAGAPPALSSVPVADLLGGTMPAVMGILAALFDAARTGRGRHVDVAIADGLLAHAVIPHMAVAGGDRARPLGTDKLTGALACYDHYATADGRWMAVGALEPKFWRRFCAVIERPDLADALPDLDAPGRDAVKAEVAAVLRQHSQAHWAALFAKEDCCVTPVLRLDEALAHPQMQARGMSVAAPAGDRQLGPPVRISGHDFAIRCDAPAPGQHTDEVLAELGWSEEEREQLRVVAAIG
ncbi:CaiB/BaiF CoA transferase family protein [Pseudacidovorax sp. NFM-22]|uniref:CaiB/BaiF CoA transferase family protein n=1 Tax=Pseudacidovorax sp. NFM-22 TaxID=2744469 RepID=UPI001F3FBFB7|nr:CaiB/BaiF CoA-transferase family protein [Pseudacidovorax sp. NFM-22]